MIIAICQITLHLHHSHSLKHKRSILKGIITKVKNKFNVSIAEIDSLELWQKATLGIVCVNTDSSHAQETLSHVVNLIEKNLTQGYIINYGIEIL